LSAVASEFDAAINRRQQHLLQVQQQLQQQGGELAQAQQAGELLQQRLAAASRAAELTVTQVAARLEQKWGKRVLRAEQKAAAMVSCCGTLCTRGTPEI
jgi:cob(I)alamin adenosyltransferase